MEREQVKSSKGMHTIPQKSLSF